MNNKLNGNEFEKIFAKALANKGYWVHRIQDNANGQPFDVIAIKDNIPNVYDCKDCKNNIFKFNRIEDNQRLAFNRYLRCKNFNCFIAIRFEAESNVAYLVPYESIKKFEKEGYKQLTYKEVKNNVHIHNTIQCC